ncbi:tetratricopeptide repeat protein [Haliangium sp.]|uniref:tetratricopeptide repeat protein n=1 Tax=Haliangium sp. TaxID=2663208 RepID=UPI003D0C6DB3
MNHRDDSPEFDLCLPLDDRPGPASRLPERHARRMVDTALEAFVAAQSAAPSVLIGAPGDGVHGDRVRAADAVPRARSRRRSVWLLAAALVFTAGAATAGLYTWMQASRPPPKTLTRAAAAPESAPEPEPEPELVPAPSPGDEPVRAPAADSSGERVGPGRVRPTPRTPRHRAATTSAAELLEQANRRRQARDWDRAEDLYQRVRNEHAGTHAAYVATVAAAGIRLDHLGDARGALRLYRAALRLGGDRALAEEARWGLAQTYRRLGRNAAERRALADFAANHPGSPRRAQVDARLRALGPPAGSAESAR